MAGRKSLKDEIQVVKYMTELAPKNFEIISKMMNSKLKADQKWAVEQMGKLYAKAIPQEITGDPERPIPIIQMPNVQRNDSDTETQEPIQEN